MSQHARHVARIRVSAALLFDLFKTTDARVISCEGIPPDAIALRTERDPATGQLFLFYEHPSFRLTEESDPVDEIFPRFTEYYGDKAMEVIGLKENLA